MRASTTEHALLVKETLRIHEEETRKNNGYHPDISLFVQSIFTDIDQTYDSNPVFCTDNSVVVCSTSQHQNAWFLNCAVGPEASSLLEEAVDHFIKRECFRVIAFTTNLQELHKFTSIRAFSTFNWYLEETVKPYALPVHYEYNTNLLFRKLHGEPIYIVAGQSNLGRL